jgi:hypothetical protein
VERRGLHSTDSGRLTRSAPDRSPAGSPRPVSSGPMNGIGSALRTAVTASCVLVAGACIAACSSNNSASSTTSTRATAPARPQSTTPTTAARGVTTTTGCALETSFDYLVRTVAPGLQASIQQLGNVNLAKCSDFLSTFQQTAGQAAGECTTIAKGSDNPGYDLNAAPAPPLKGVIESAGPGC